VYEEGESEDILYPAGVPPDGTPVAIAQTYNAALVIVCYILALCGVIFSTFFLVLNFLYRKTKVIRLTTPVLSYVIICGALLMYLSVFIGVLSTINETVIKMQCIVHMWLYGVGYLLVYGTILAKMWRVYQIFHNPNPNKTILKTWHLLCVVCGVTGGGVLIILARTVAQALTDPQLVTNRENPEGKMSSDVRVDYKVWQCYNSGSAPFILDLLIFIYLGLLQLVGIILAFQTRKVRIPILNDSKSVMALIYISSIVLLVIVLTTFILRGYINVSAALFSGGILSLATFSLVFIFVPKVTSLYGDPEGKKIFSNLDPTTKRSEQSQIRDNYNSMVAGMSELNDSEKVTMLSSQLARLKETLSDKNRRITELETVISSTS
jgi:gamma-aminobutyric acid type B receptor